MRYLLLALIVLLLVLSACSKNVEITNFEDCAAFGEEIVETNPRQCYANGEVFVEGIDESELIEETPEKPCTREYIPVCGEVEIPCGNTPCESVLITFPNRCMAENAGATIVKEDICVSELRDACQASENGNWVEGFDECEFIDQETCENLGGTYNECGSACRNDPDAEICTLQCVPYCSME